MANTSKVHPNIFGDISNDDYVDSSKSFAIANNFLGLSLHRELSKDGGNVFFSPMSISMAFAMLFRGTRGISAKELKTVLGYDEAKIDDTTVHEHFAQILKLLADSPKEYTLSIVNALLVQKNFPFLPDFKKDVQEMYLANLQEVDFRHESEKVIEEINEWVKDKTKNMIQSLFKSLDPNTVMVLLNAVYFKGTWVHQFDTNLTRPKTFYNYGLQSKAKKVPMMFLKENFPLFENLTFQALQLPYKGEGIVMIVVLPYLKEGLAALERRIISGELTIPIKEFRNRGKVNVSLPKLHLEYSKDMNDVLTNLGIRSLFSDSDADLSGLSDCPYLYVSQVVHKAALDVNEEGTKAAAVTGIAVTYRCFVEEAEFTADHPFLFLIVDKRNDTILFMGRVEEL